MSDAAGPRDRDPREAGPPDRAAPPGRFPEGLPEGLPERLPEGLPGGFAERIGLDADRRRDLEAFHLMVTRANATMNLVGDSTLGDFWRRHVIDSAQLAWFSPEARVWADLGSGAGLPGVVLAILMKNRPGGRVHLVESRAGRARFLAETVAALDLPATVHHARAESLTLGVEVVTARACAPLERLLGLVHPFMARGARAILLKGRDVDAEIARARTRWRFGCETAPSLSDPAGRVLFVTGLAHAPRA